jgi:TolB-like protein/tetratricopeptide (TPR) repeat protein
MSNGGSSTGSDEAPSLLPPRWAELAPLVDAVLDEPPERRNEILDRLTRDNPDRRAELEQLVKDCERELPLLNRPAAESFAGLFADESQVQLPDVLGDRYHVQREVGRGGMARVFLARDLKHNRDVAVKIIRDDIAASVGSARFLQEIAIAARLRHPNIVPMYDSGESDGVLYFVMPYEEGPSLKERMKQQAPLPTSERISILRDIARALAYAHERGVVHRDVKPDNVLLSGGAAVVSDFGVAKAVSEAQADSPGGVITQSGSRIGTPVYMAPEQAVGDPGTDHRADIYSFGCLAYELFAGRPPFDHATTHEVIAAHIGTKPAAISDASPGIPESVATLIMDCLEKSPADRPQNGGELLRRLEGEQGPQRERKESRSTHSASRNIAIAAAFVALIGAGYLMVRNSTTTATMPAELTVAVLPLLSSGDSVEHELAYGLSDEIATALVKVPGVRVMSRRGAAATPEARDIDPEATGRALGAQFLVTGSLRQVSGRLTVLATLVQAKDGAVLWAEQFDRTMDELGAVRDEIAESVGDSLRRRSGVAASGAGARPVRAIAPEPYRLYVLAQRALDVRGQSLERSAEMFRRATELDTLYAEAFAGLSLALALTPHFKPVSTKEIAADANAAARRALYLDSTLALPHVALGIVHGYAYRWDSAGIELRTGVRLRSPSDVEPLVQYGRYLLFREQPAEALRQFLIARRTEPASALVRSWVSYAYLLLGEMDSAIVESNRAFQSDSTNYSTLTLGVYAHFRAGDLATTRDYLRRITGNPQNLFYVYAAMGDSAITRTRVDDLKRQGAVPWVIERARAYSLLGSRDTIGAIAAFERITDANDVWPSRNPISDPMFDLVRSHPRFQRLLKRVGLR